MNLINLEKIILGLSFLIVVSVASVKYIMIGDISPNWLNLVTVLGGLFVTRKALSYFKKDSYLEQNTTIEQTTSETNTEVKK